MLLACLRQATPRATALALTSPGPTACLQIPWVDDPEFIKAWEESRTGYPW